MSAGEIFQFIGGGSVLTLAIAILKFILEMRDAIKDIKATIDKTNKIEEKLQKLRDWAVKQGYDERRSDL